MKILRWGFCKQRKDKLLSFLVDVGERIKGLMMV